MDSARRKNIIADLHHTGLDQPVEVLPRMPTLDELLEDYVSRYTVQHRSPTLSLYTSADGKRKIKVQKLVDDTVTCSCAAYAADRTRACGHIGDFCIQNNLEIPGGWFSLARRLEPSIVVYPKGQPQYATRRNRAYRSMPEHVRALAFELCQSVSDPPRRRVGRPSIPRRVLLYCLLLKVAFSETLYDVRHNVTADPNLAKLGWKGDAPNWNRLSACLGEEEITSDLDAMVECTAGMGRALDYALLVDGSGFGTTMLRNWRGTKYGSVGKVRRKKKSDRLNDVEGDSEGTAKEERLRDVFEAPGTHADERKANLKSFRGYIKAHTAAGAISGLIYAVETTLNFGEGSGDIRHFQHLVRRAARIGTFEALLADKGYFSEQNYTFAQDEGYLLFVLPKKGDALEGAAGGRELFAYMNALREAYPHIYRRFYRLRSKIETFFSSQKRRTGHIRSKIRNGDIDRMYGLRHDPYPCIDSTPEPVRRLREEICRMNAVARVGTAHANEARLKCVALNLRTLCRLKQTHGEFDLTKNTPVPAMPRVSLPAA